MRRKFWRPFQLHLTNLIYNWNSSNRITTIKVNREVTYIVNHNRQVLRDKLKRDARALTENPQLGFRRFR